MDSGQTSAYYDTRRTGIHREATELSSSPEKPRTQDAGLNLDLAGIRSHASELPVDTESRYDELLRQIGDAQIVMIGEATHGTHEFYEERARITKRLIEEKDFSLLVCEAEVVDMERVDRYVSGASADDSAAAALSGFKRYPLWVWRNKVVEDFVEWARQHNESGVSIHGIDLHGLYKSLKAVMQYLEKRDPEAAERARRLCRVLTAYAPDPHTYGFAASGAGGRPGCECDVASLLRDMRELGPPASAREGRHRCQDDEYFFALQNAVVVKEAEVYYRKIYESYEDAWTIRDRHMFNALVDLKEHCEALCGGVCRAVVWAHNCHVSDARATEVAWEWHQVNMGQLVKEKYGDQAVSIGFSTYCGHLTAAPAWGEPGRCVQLKPPLQANLEHILHEVSPTNFLLDCRQVEPRELCLWKRSIGLVYEEDNEDRDNYYRAKIFEQHDKIIHIDQTSAVEPLDKESVWSKIEESDEPPQTYPFGI